MAAFDQNKYKNIFEQRFGKGSYDAGLSNARSIGASKAQADFEKEEYKRRLSEYKAAQKNKTAQDALSSWGDPSSNSLIKRDGSSLTLDEMRKNGAYRTAEEIRNDPYLQQQVKDKGFSVTEYIDSLYDVLSGGQYRSEREYNKFADGLKKQVVADEKDVFKKYGIPKGTEQEKKQGDLNALKKQEKNQGDLSVLQKGKNFFTSKDVDGDGERDGLLGLVDRFVAPISKSATDGFISGNTEAMAKNDPDNPVVKAALKDRGTETKVLNTIGTIAAFTAPYAKGYKAAEFAVNKVPTLARIANPYAKKAVTGAIAGGLAEGGISAVNELANSEAYDIQDHAIRTGIGVAAGAVLDPALHGIYNLVKGARGAKNAARTTPTSQKAEELPLGLPEPQRQLPEPQMRLPQPNRVEPSLESLNNTFRQPAGLSNPIPEMPDIMRIAANRGRYEQAGVNFAQSGRYEPKSRPNLAPVVQSADPMNRGQAYWQGRYEEFAKHVNDNYDMNEMTPEALEDLWSSFARYDEPIRLEQAVDMAYPRGFEPPAQTPRATEAIPEPTPEAPLTQALREDPRVNELIQGLYPPAKPEPRVSRPATLEESFQSLREMAAANSPGTPEPSLEPLMFKRPAGSLERIMKQGSNANENQPLFMRLRDLNSQSQAKQAEPKTPPKAKASNPTNQEAKQVTDAIQDIDNQIKIISNRITNNPRQRTTLQPVLEQLEQEKAEMMMRLNLQQFGESAAVRSPGNADSLADSFRSKVDRNPKKDNRLKEIASNLRTQFIDDLAPLENLERDVRGYVASAEESLYKQGRLFRGSSEKANQIVETRLTPVLKNIKKSGYTGEDLGDYALAVHAKDVNAKGIKSGFTDDEINAVINKFKNPAMEQARKDLVKLSNDLLDDLAESGVISKQAVKDMKKKHPNYMPLFRSFDDDKVEFTNGLGKALSMGSSPLKKLEGSDRQVIDPLESVVKNIFKLTNAADRNKVAGQLGKLATEDTENQFIRQLSPGEEVGRKNVISSMVNGQKVQYEVPPEVYKAMMNLDRESSLLLIKILQKPAGTLRAGATLTPEFSLRNPIRDVWQAYAVSNTGFNPFIDFPVGLFQSAMKGKSIKVGGKEFKAPDKMYRQFIEDNGGLGNIVSVDRDMHKKAIEDALKGNSKHFINVVNPKAWLGVLRTIADVSESATKVGVYRSALRSGASRQEAAYQARDIMDFARAGVSTREANKVVAFLNANIQGKSKLLRAIKENPVGVTMRSLSGITIPTIGVFLAQKYMASDEQKRLIDDAPSWLKNTFWLVPVPGTKQVARIPKPFDLAPVFANLPERALEYFANNDPAAFDNFARESFSSYTIPVMLTGLTPILEGMANYSAFRDAPIIPKRESNLNYPDQYDVNTSEIAKALGKGIDKLTGGTGPLKNFGSPRVVDNTIRGFTGGLGTYATDFIDLIVEETGMVDDVERPEKDFLTEQTPLKAFLVNKNSTGESVNKLYNLKDKLSRARGSYNDSNEDGEFPQEAQYQFVNDVTKEISEISKAIRMIENDPNMDGKLKRQEIDKLNKLRNYLSYEIRKRIEAQQ